MKTFRLHRMRGLALALALPLAPIVAQAQHAGHGTRPAPPTSPATPATPPRPAAGNASPRPDAPPPLPSPSPSPAPATVDHDAMGHGGHEQAPTPTRPIVPIPDPTDADREAAFPPVAGHAVHDRGIHSFFLLDRLEAWDADPGDALAWEAQGWIGGDLHRVWLRSEGERIGGDTESAELEVLYGRGIARWWDLVAGVRHDFAPGASRDFVALGVQGLAPGKFEVGATAYLGERGQSATRLEAEYELLLTNRLILQPQVEINAYGKDDPSRGIGAGLSTAEVGLRLRYEFTRKFAPYIGLVRERAFGDTADLRRADGDSIDDTRVVVGLRTWF